MASSNNTYIVLLLDGRQYSCKLNSKTLTEELFDCVISYLGIQEREYFGLCYISEPGKYREWIALEKRLVSTLLRKISSKGTALSIILTNTNNGYSNLRW